MRYERELIQREYAADVIEELEDYYSDWKLIGFTYNNNSGLYVAVIEREVKE